MSKIAGTSPQARWQLTAPESYVLLNGPIGNGAEAFKMGLLELVARQTVRVVVQSEQRRFRPDKTISVITQGATYQAPSEPTLRCIWDAFRNSPSKDFRDGTVGVPVSELVSRIRQRYPSLEQYVSYEVLPSLVRRGMYFMEERKVLWIFPGTARYILTPEGRAAREELESMLERGADQLHDWVQHDPKRAAAFAALAGAAVLMMGSSYADLQQLGEDVKRHRYADSGTNYGGSSSGGSDGGEPWEMPDELDLISLSAFDLGALDSIGDAFSAIDADVGSDSGGGGDGGGDGGGGNGGGGGD